MDLKDMVEDTLKKLQTLEEEYYNAYNGRVFELSVYLYMRYGEIPLELYDKLEEVEKILKRANSLFDESINTLVEDIIDKEE